MSDVVESNRGTLTARHQALDAKKAPLQVTKWFHEALAPGTPEWQAYRVGLFELGDDVVKYLGAFDEFAEDKRRRAYHRLIEALLAAQEWEAARHVAKALRGELGERAWLSYRHFFLWRILVGAIAGHAVLGGSATWLSAARRLGEAPPIWLIAYCSAVWILLPLAWEVVMAPPHLWKRFRAVTRRVLTVSVNAVVATGVVAGIQLLVWRFVMQPDVPKEWAGMEQVSTVWSMAATSTLLGYVVTLFWRDRPLAGPA